MSGRRKRPLAQTVDRGGDAECVDEGIELNFIDDETFQVLGIKYDGLYFCSEAFNVGYPPGPSSLPELFNWRQYNADVLMSLPDLRCNFTALLEGCNRICLHEDYAGIGTAGFTLLQQFLALKNIVAADLQSYSKANMLP